MIPSVVLSFIVGALAIFVAAAVALRNYGEASIALTLLAGVTWIILTDREEGH